MADRRLQVFHAVAKHLSFTRAAETLFMTQPAVTSQVKQLEEHLNTRLFDRAQGRIALTPAGQVAFEYAERILGLSQELDRRMKELSGQASGPLLIGASMTIGEYVLPQLIGKFKARFPAVVPTLFVGNSEAVQDRVAERSLDLGFIEGDSHRPSLHSEVCCEDELQVEIEGAPAFTVTHDFRGGSVNGTTISDSTVTVELGQVGCDGSDIAVTVPGVNGASGSVDASATMTLRTGDVNADGRVGTADLKEIRMNVGRGLVNDDNFRDDITVDGKVNHGDTTLEKSTL